MKKIIIFLSICLAMSISMFAQDTPKEFNLSDCGTIIKVSNPEAIFDEFAPLLARIDKYAEMMMSMYEEEPSEVSVTEQFKAKVMEFIDDPYVNKEGSFYLVCYKGFFENENMEPKPWFLLVPIKENTNAADIKVENSRVVGNFLITSINLSYYEEAEDTFIPAITVDDALSLEQNIVMKIDFDVYQSIIEMIEKDENTAEDPATVASVAQLQFIIDNLDYMEFALYYENDTINMFGFCQPVADSMLERFIINAGDGTVEDMLKFLPNKDYAGVTSAIMDMDGRNTEMLEMLKSSCETAFGVFPLGMYLEKEHEELFDNSVMEILMSICVNDFAFGYTSPYSDKANNAVLVGVVKMNEIKDFKANIDNLMLIANEIEIENVEEWYDGDYEEYLAQSTTIRELDITNKFNAVAPGEYVQYNITIPSYYSDPTVLSIYVGYVSEGYLVVTFGPERFEKALAANMTETLNNIKNGGINGFTSRADFKDASQFFLPKSKQVGLVNLSNVMSSVLDTFVTDPMQKTIFGNMLKTLPYPTTLSGVRYSTNYANGRNEFIMSVTGNDLEYLVNTFITAMTIMWM